VFSSTLVHVPTRLQSHEPAHDYAPQRLWDLRTAPFTFLCIDKGDVCGCPMVHILGADHDLHFSRSEFATYELLFPVLTSLAHSHVQLVRV
jgi:hypothetical protein